MSFVVFEPALHGVAAQSPVAAAEPILVAAMEPVLELVDVGPEGHELEVEWAGAAGVDGVEVLRAPAQVGGATTGETLHGLTTSDLGTGHRQVTFPAGRRMRSLSLSGLKWVKSDETEHDLRSESDLVDNDLRLVLSVPEGSDWRPLHAVPQLPATAFRPTSLAGATFAGRVLSFPPLGVGKVRISLVEGRSPEEFEPRALKVDVTTGEAVVVPRDAELVGPDGQPAWAFPGELTEELAAAEVDLRFALEDALQKRLDGGGEPAVTFRLRAAAPARVYLGFRGATGRLVRTFPGVLSTHLEGDPVRLGLPAGGPPLAGERPASVTADLTVTYAGIRILEGASDELPAAPGGVDGAVLGDRWTRRELPPQALGQHPLARVGLIGRSPAGCELSVRAVDPTVPGGPPLGDPGVVELAASPHLGTAWVELPGDGLRDPLAIEARCTRGRFFWAGGEGRLVRLAVFDPDPGGRPLLLDSGRLLGPTERETHLPGHALPRVAFAGHVPALTSSLFLTVDLSDLALRYAR